ncbi:MAG TPA: immunoglobulin domain-containing protein, partial [Thermoanaerobaculia bacterium]|nr:immunoglobulin domain-containing protein [Thermoanaerobaculia bacterium]
MRARRSLGILEAFVAAFLAAAEARAGGTWSSIPNPPGFSGQVGALHGGATTLFLGSGFSKLWTSPLASPFQFTPFPSTGLGYPMAIDRLFSNASDEPLLVLGNILSGFQSSLWYYDTAAAAWKQAAPASLFFAKPPRVCRTKGGHLLASTADSIYASTDGGRSWALRTTMTTWISAPPPLPASGAAVGDPSYGTNLIHTAYPGYTLAFDVMPWGEIFLGNETLQAWHSYDEGFTWEHVDPLWLEPQRDMTGVPQYVNPHMTTFGRDSNTAGSGETKDAEVLLNGDQNDQQNFYRLTTTGQIVPLDVSHVVLPHTDPTTMAVTLVNLGQSKSFTTLRSGETLSAPTPWDHSNANINPDGRNAAEITRWDGSQLDLASPPSGTWAPFFSDSSFTATDGALFYALSTATSNNVMAYAPDPQSNQRPVVNLVASPVTVTMSAATGLASLSPASSFSVSDDGLPSGTLSYRWSARGHGPVTFDDPFGAAPTAYFRMPGHYVLTLVVDDGARTSGNAVLVHVLPAAGGSAPAITAQPSNQLLTPGGPVTFTVAATGSGLVHQWLRNGVELADGPAYSGTS